MKKIAMGIVFTMILAAGVTTSLAADSFRGGCDYAGTSCGWLCVDEYNDGVCDYAGQGNCRYADADGDGVCDNYGIGNCGRGAGFVDEDGDGICDFGGGSRPMDGTGYRRCGRNR